MTVSICPGGSGTRQRIQPPLSRRLSMSTKRPYWLVPALTTAIGAFAPSAHAGHACDPGQDTCIDLFQPTKHSVEVFVESGGSHYIAYWINDTYQGQFWEPANHHIFDHVLPNTKYSVAVASPSNGGWAEDTIVTQANAPITFGVFRPGGAD